MILGLSACPSVCLVLCLILGLSVCPSVCLILCLVLCLILCLNCLFQWPSGVNVCEDKIARWERAGTVRSARATHGSTASTGPV